MLLDDKKITKFSLENIKLTKYLFFTGKGGVGKTSVACATAITLSDSGKKVLLLSTDPASNLQDVFETQLDGKGKQIEGANNLTVINVDPLLAAAEYRESVIAPYRGMLPDNVIVNMEEQLSGSCTVEIAAFNEFTRFLADDETEKEYDYIIFDTAPTGHTLRMLQLPSAWSNFISENTHGASCLGQLSGLEDKKGVYKEAVTVLCDKNKTTLILVTRPDTSAFREADRAAKELKAIGVNNQILIINGIMEYYDDEVSTKLYQKQQSALGAIPENLKILKTFYIPLRAYNVLGLDKVRDFLTRDIDYTKKNNLEFFEMNNLSVIVERLYKENKRVVFTMGKGGVGKTTIAAAIAMGLAEKGKEVHLTTTDPASHLQNVLSNNDRISTSFIDEKEELRIYSEEVLKKAKESNMSESDIAYIEEDLRSPCTQEIAVFKAFAKVVEKSVKQVVIIDTAPTGHTLLLLDSTESYHKEVKRNQGIIPDSVRKLLPTLRDKKQTEVIIITLAEATPYYEAMRLEEDLKRAEIDVNWWVINSSYLKTGSTNKLLAAKADNEIEWINKVNSHTNGKFALLKWHAEDIKDEKLLELFND